MNYSEMKTNVLALIEESNPNSELLTDKPAISAKINKAINHVMFELARIEKVAKCVEIAVNKGHSIKFADKRNGEFYRVKKKDKGKHIIRASGTVYEITDEDTAEIDRSARPKRITPKRANKNYTFGLSADLLEIMPYGIAADLLKNDETAENGTANAAMYESMLHRLDPRNTTI